MSIEPTLRPERIDTDASLQAERDKTDEEIVARSAAIERHADDVLDLARERADLVLQAARQEIDDSLTASGQHAVAVERLTVAREAADDALAEERSAADDRLEDERSTQKGALMVLLALEREETDDSLLTERVHADGIVASRDDFLAMVSHDVRGILGAMAMCADVLLHPPSDHTLPQLAQREGHRIQRLTGRMNRLIGDLLDVVSMESGTLSMVATRQDAAPVIAEAIETLRFAAAARTVELLAEVDGELYAELDRGRILQVLTNLIGNALKFTPTGGTVDVRAAIVDDMIKVTVRDTGEGIQPGRLEAIFERFEQAGYQDRRGLGLGLYIARSIIAAHHGRIWAESEPAQGSSFHFTLPTTTATTTATA